MVASRDKPQQQSMRFLGHPSALVGLALACVAGTATADDPTAPTAKRDPDASFGQMFAGPFPSSRLFTMPTADVIGAYMLSLSGDGSLLQDPGRLTSAAVVAIGFGDLAQLEYRETGAISVTGVDAPLPALGVQLKLPLPRWHYMPAIGVAVRVGVERDETFGTTKVGEKVTDFYVVARERITPWLVLHGGVRVSPATLAITGDSALPDATLHRTLALPTAGIELVMNRDAMIVGEVAEVPQFRWTVNTADPPKITYGLQARLGLRWRLAPSVVFDASLGYQLESSDPMASDGLSDLVSQWDIRLGAEVFVPWGALACRTVHAFCD